MFRANSARSLRTAAATAGGAEVDPAETDAMLAVLAPYLRRKPDGEGDFFGRETRRRHSLVTKTPQVGSFFTGRPVEGARVRRL